MVCTVAVSQTHRIAKPSLILGAPTEHIGRWANTCISVSVPHTLLLCCFSCPCLRDSVGYLADSKLSLSIMCWTDDGRSHLRVITCNQQRERTHGTDSYRQPDQPVGIFQFHFCSTRNERCIFHKPQSQSQNFTAKRPLTLVAQCGTARHDVIFVSGLLLFTLPLGRGISTVLVSVPLSRLHVAIVLVALFKTFLAADKSTDAVSFRLAARGGMSYRGRSCMSQPIEFFQAACTHDVGVSHTCTEHLSERSMMAQSNESPWKFFMTMNRLLTLFKLYGFVM